MVSDDTYSPDGIMFIITFEDKESSTRIMAEVNIQDTHLTILAYYIYQYPSQWNMISNITIVSIHHSLSFPMLL